MTQTPHSGSPFDVDQETTLPEYLSVHQTAALLQMPRGSLVALLKAGAVKSERQGGRLVISAAAYLAYRHARNETRQRALDHLAVLDAVLL